MRRTAVFVAALLAFAGVGLADWVNVGPEGGPIYSATVAPTTPPTLYVGATATYTPLLKSTDNGNTWTAAGAALTNYPYQLAVHPNDPQRLYGVVSSIFYTSTDGGATWSQSSLGSNTYGQDIVINPQNPQVIYCPGYKYDGALWKVNLAKSTDGGVTWTPNQIDTITSTTVYSAAIDPVDTSVIYVGAWYNNLTRVYKSTDCGATWNYVEFPANAYYVYSMMVSPTDHNIVFAGTLYGVYRSTDAGASWTRQSTNNYNYRIVVAPGEPDRMFSASYSGVYKSTDAGLTWTACGAGITGTTVRTVIAVPGASGTILAGSTAGMFRSTDYGATWTPVNSGIVIGKIPVVSHVPGRPGETWIEFIDNDMFRTTDNGATWLHATTPLSCGNVCNIAFNPADPQRVWLLEGSG
jgi:photosystem II stability/assembly factor-like uncharacterized protein